MVRDGRATARPLYPPGYDQATTDARIAAAVAAGSSLSRQFYLSAEGATLDSGTFANIGSTPDIIRAIALADAATQGCTWNFPLPGDWNPAGTTITFTPIWSSGSADAVAHTVRWALEIDFLVAGNQVSRAGSSFTQTGSSAVRIANGLVIDTPISITISPTSPLPILCKAGLRRIGADGADTYVGVVNLHGVLVTYVSVN